MKTKILLRALSLFLVLCSIIGIFPVSAFATHEHVSDPHSHCVEENCNTCDVPVGEGITVALLDSGIQSYPVQAAVDFVGEKEYSSHGDEMAAVLLENAPAVSLMDVRVLNAEGVGEHSDVADGILWATDHGAQIIVMSFAGVENSKILKEAVEYAAEHGVVMVAAAGNDMKNTATFPAAYAQVLSVGALDAQGHISLGSNSGAYVDLYVEAEGGTSHAAQVVAASIAKLMQERSEVTSVEIYDELSTLVYKSDLLVEQSEDGMVFAAACLFHKWGSYRTTVSPTCTSAGQKVRYCSKCGKAQYASIAKLGHSARSYYTTTKAATCTSSGTKVKYCVRCSYVCASATISALGHSWGSYTTTKAATCTVKGQECRTCNRCGTKSYRTTAALGHYQNSYPSLTVQATCTAQGYSVYRCARCKIDMSTKYTAALGHSWGSYTTTKAATCTESGQECKTCSRCGTKSYRTTSSLGGHYQNSYPSLTVQATCTAQGYSVYRCARCKIDMSTQYTPALGHSYGEYYTVQQPTCTETGLKVKTCSRCGDNSTCTIAKVPHAIYTDEICELSDVCEAIYYAKTKCRNCTTDFGGYKEVRRNPNQHTPGDYVTVKEPTCLEAGEIARYCTHCGLRTATVTGDPALGHDEKKVVVEQAYCVGEGKAEYVCTRCEKTVRTKAIPATGVHNFVKEIFVYGSCHVDEEGVNKCRDCPLEEEYTITSEWFKREHEGAGNFCKMDYNGSQELYCRKCQLFVDLRGQSGSWTEHIGSTTYNYIYFNSKETEKLIEQIETAGDASAILGSILGIDLLVNVAFFVTIQDIKAAAEPGRGIVIEQQFDGATGSQSFLIIYSQ